MIFISKYGLIGPQCSEIGHYEHFNFYLLKVYLLPMLFYIYTSSI